MSPSVQILAGRRSQTVVGGACCLLALSLATGEAQAGEQAVRPVLRLDIPQGPAWSASAPASYSLAPLEALFLLDLGGSALHYRGGAFAAPRYDSNPLQYSAAGGNWMLDAGVRPLDLFWDLKFGDFQFGIGPTVALDLGLRTNFQGADYFFLRPEVGVSLDELLFLGVRYSYTVDAEVSGIETVVGMDLLALIDVMSAGEQQPEL